MGQGLVHVGQADDLGVLVDLIALEALGIAAAVLALLFMQRDDGHPLELRAEGLQHPEALLGVLADEGEFLGSEHPGLLQDAPGDARHADIVQAGGQGQALQVLLAIADALPDLDGEDGHVDQVPGQVEMRLALFQGQHDEPVLARQGRDQVGDHPLQRAQLARLPGADRRHDAGDLLLGRLVEGLGGRGGMRLRQKRTHVGEGKGLVLPRLRLLAGTRFSDQITQAGDDPTSLLGYRMVSPIPRSEIRDVLMPGSPPPASRARHPRPGRGWRTPPGGTGRTGC